MPNAIASSRTLTRVCDTLYANTGTIGYVALLRPTLTLGLGFTADATTNLLTTASAHALTTGSRVRVAVSGGTLPTPLAGTVDYFAIVVSTTTLRLAATVADATATTPIPIDLTDAGTGTLALNEQELNKDDLISVLLAKELTHPNWAARVALSEMGASQIVGNNGEKLPKSLAVQVTGVTPLSYKHVLLLIGSGVTGTIGSTPTGNFTDYLCTEGTTQTINQGEIKSIVFRLRVLPS